VRVRLPPPKTPTPAPPVRVGCFGRAWDGVIALSVIGGIVAAGYTFQPNVTVTAAEPLRPGDMLSTPFTVRNEGPVGVRDVRFVCQIDTLVTSVLQFIQNNRLTERTLTRRLSPGESVTGGCYAPNFTGNIIGTAGRQMLVRLSIEVRFTHLPIRLPGHVLAGFRTAPTGKYLRWTSTLGIPIWRSE
jgi:hypothetical protein